MMWHKFQILEMKTKAVAREVEYFPVESLEISVSGLVTGILVQWQVTLPNQTWI